MDPRGSVPQDKAPLLGGGHCDSFLQLQVPEGGLPDGQAQLLVSLVLCPTANRVQVLCLLCSFSLERSVGLSLVLVTLILESRKALWKVPSLASDCPAQVLCAVTPQEFSSDARVS